MKRIVYTIMSALICSISANTHAQVWRPKNSGLPHGFQAKTVYGDGTRILLSNTSSFSGHQMYYTPDTSTDFNFSASVLGPVATAESHIVKCRNVLFVGSSAGIFKSYDNGVTWVTAGTNTTNHMPTYSIYAHNDTLYSGSILGPSFSTDTATTWTALAGYTGSLVVSLVKTGATLYVGGTSGLQYTTDNGASWTNVTAPGTLVGSSVADLAVLGSNVYAGTNNGVHQTTDNGHTWTRVLSQSMFSLTAIDTSLFGGTAGSGIYRSDLTGTAWSQVNTGLPFTGVAAYDAVNSISFNDDFAIATTAGDSSIYVVGLGELGLHSSDPTLGAQLATQKARNCILYPNPAKDEVIIRNISSANNKVSITIYDVTGRCCARTAVYNNSADIKVDLGNILAGVYYIHITTGDETAIEKLVVIK